MRRIARDDDGLASMRESIREFERELAEARQDADRLANVINLMLERLPREDDLIHQIAFVGHDLSIGDIVHGALAMHILAKEQIGEE